jgi:hypothetical protein
MGASALVSRACDGTLCPFAALTLASLLTFMKEWPEEGVFICSRGSTTSGFCSLARLTGPWGVKTQRFRYKPTAGTGMSTSKRLRMSCLTASLVQSAKGNLSWSGILPTMSFCASCSCSSAAVVAAVAFPAHRCLHAELAKDVSAFVGAVLAGRAPGYY